LVNPAPRDLNVYTDLGYCNFVIQLSNVIAVLEGKRAPGRRVTEKNQFAHTSRGTYLFSLGLYY
jgi:hypothetical protein